jgi:hypothetical protein
MTNKYVLEEIELLERTIEVCQRNSSVGILYIPESILPEEDDFEGRLFEAMSQPIYVKEDDNEPEVSSCFVLSGPDEIPSEFVSFQRDTQDLIESCEKRIDTLKKFMVE